MNNLLLLARLPVLEALVRWGVGVLTANAITLVLLFLVRFVLSDRAIFGPARPENGRGPVRILVDLTAPPPAGRRPRLDGRKRSRYLPYRYDIAGVLTIGSQILLPGDGVLPGAVGSRPRGGPHGPGRRCRRQDTAQARRHDGVHRPRRHPL